VEEVHRKGTEGLAEGRRERRALTMQIDPFLLVLRYEGGGGSETKDEEEEDKQPESSAQGGAVKRSYGEDSAEDMAREEESGGEPPRKPSQVISMATPTRTQTDAMMEEREKEAEHLQRYEREKEAMKAWEVFQALDPELAKVELSLIRSGSEADPEYAWGEADKPTQEAKGEGTPEEAMVRWLQAHQKEDMVKTWRSLQTDPASQEKKGRARRRRHDRGQGRRRRGGKARRERRRRNDGGRWR